MGAVHPKTLLGDTTSKIIGGTTMTFKGTILALHLAIFVIVFQEGNAIETRQSSTGTGFEQVLCSANSKQCDCWPAQDWHFGFYPHPKYCWRKCILWQNFIWRPTYPGQLGRPCLTDSKDTTDAKKCGACKCVSTVANCRPTNNRQYLYQVLHGYN